MVTLALVSLRLLGLLRTYSVPTGAMNPAVSVGDHVLMEGLTFLVRKPHRGDIVVFKTAGIASLPEGPHYVKRVAGEPGDQLRIADGRLYINDKHIALSNALGEITYFLPTGSENMAVITNQTIPASQYFLLGDNSMNSHDSRFWGCVPARNILGRVAFCYAPASRVGTVR